MNFRDALDNIKQYGNSHGFYCVPIPFLDDNFAHCADQLTVRNDALGGLLAVTHNGLWYPFWPKKARERSPEIPSEPNPSGYYAVEGYTDWKDACIAALNPEDYIFPNLNDRTDRQCNVWREGTMWRDEVRSRLSRLRDPFVAEVNEGLLCELKKMEAGEEF